MADWSTTFGSSDLASQSDVYNSFVDALNERLDAAGFFGIPHVTSGTGATTTGGGDPTSLTVLTARAFTWRRCTASNQCVQPGQAAADYTSFDSTFYAPAVGEYFRAAPYLGSGFYAFGPDYRQQWSNGAATGWYLLQVIAACLSRFYYDPSWDPTSDTIAVVNDSNNAQVQGRHSYTVTPHSPLGSSAPYWPLPNGPTRKREKIITSLGETGTTGNKVRFIYSTSTIYLDGYSDPFHPPVIIDHNASSSDQIGNSGKVYVRSSGSWTEVSDPASSPDLDTLYGVAARGDRFGPWILNDLRDAIRAMTRTLVAATGVGVQRLYIGAASMPACRGRTRRPIGSTRRPRHRRASSRPATRGAMAPVGCRATTSTCGALRPA